MAIPTLVPPSVQLRSRLRWYWRSLPLSLPVVAAAPGSVQADRSLSRPAAVECLE